MYYTDSSLKIINENDLYTDVNGTNYPRNFPKSEIPGVVAVKETPQPNNPNFIVTGFHIDSTFTQVWSTIPYLPAPTSVLDQIASLESSVTSRMIQEALIGSTLTFADGPYVGQTSAQAIATIRADIASLRASLS